jgi:transcriptional regulator with XRE-family HTH domain
MLIGQVIRTRRKSLGMTQEDLADRIGKDQNYVSFVETGRIKRPGREVLRAFVDALELDYDEALRIADYAPEFDGDPRKGVEPGEDAIMTTRAKVPADASRWALMLEGYEGRDVRVPSDWITSAAHPLFAVDVSGNCLESLLIADGDVVICEEYEGQPIEDGKVVLVRVDGECTLKRWYRRGSGRVELRNGDGVVVRELSSTDTFEVLGVFYRLIR